MNLSVDAPPLGERTRAVIIDDTADLRDLLRIALERGGFEVVAEAGDGRSGIETVREHRPDVVLIDLAMPVMDGIEALPSLRRLVPAAKIIVLSGFGAQVMSARAVAAGADGYVQKGAPLSSILDYVTGLVSGQRESATPRRALSVVSEPATASGPAAERVSGRAGGAGGPARTLPDAGRPAAGDQPDHASSAEMFRQAPYGVVELADEPLFRLRHANQMAGRLLGEHRPGTPLAVFAPELATMVSYHRLDSDATFETDIDGGRVRATLRRTPWSVLVFLDSTVEDVGMLRRAIATTAHEVRGPVAVLCGIAETIAWDGDTMAPEQNRRLMGSVARQAQILDRITADLLTAAQIQRGTLRIDLQVVEPRPLIEAAVADRWDVEVRIDDARSVVADPLRLEQMLTNLLSNAHKYGAAPFQVVVRPGGRGSSPQEVCIDVVDHGDGVPAEFRGRLFSEFARAHGAVATGTGLGLYVVRTLARAQHGDVGYAVDDGASVFTITLPAD